MSEIKKLSAKTSPNPFAAFAVNPFGVPWHIEKKHGLVHRSDGLPLGSIRHHKFQTPDVVNQWLCGAAEVANSIAGYESGTLPPLSFEMINRLPDISYGIVALTKILSSLLDSEDPKIRKMMHDSFNEKLWKNPQWFEACHTFTTLVETPYIYADADKPYIAEQWGHYPGWVKQTLPGVQSLQLQMLPPELLTAAQAEIFVPENKSYLYGRETRQVLFHTEKWSFDKDYPQATSLFCKMLQSVCNVVRLAHPMAAPETSKALAAAIEAIWPKLGKLEKFLHEIEKQNPKTAKKALVEVEKIADALRAHAKDHTIRHVLQMRQKERKTYYDLIAHKWIKLRRKLTDARCQHALPISLGESEGSVAQFDAYRAEQLPKAKRPAKKPKKRRAKEIKGQTLLNL